MAPSLVPVDRAGLPGTGRAGGALPSGCVYLWTADPSRPLGGTVTAAVVPLLRLDNQGAGRGRLWGRFVRVRNDGVVSRPDPATGSARPVLIGDAQPNADGDFLFDPRRDRGVPFQGGRYRLPSHRYTDAWEYTPVSPDGEIHLGPGRSALQFGALVEAAGGPYQHNASHNGAILYHEYGHHINRHTA